MLRAFKTAVRGTVTGCHDNGAERRDRLILTANATMAGPGSFLAGVMIGIMTDALHARRLQGAIPNNPRKADHPRDGVLRRRKDSARQSVGAIQKEVRRGRP